MNVQGRVRTWITVLDHAWCVLEKYRSYGDRINPCVHSGCWMKDLGTISYDSIRCIRYWHGWVHSLNGLHVRLYIHGLIQSRTFTQGLVRPLINTITHGLDIRTVCFFKHMVRLSRIHLNGPCVIRVRPRLVRLYVRITRVDNRVSCVYCVRIQTPVRIVWFQINLRKKS